MEKVKNLIPFLLLVAEILNSLVRDCAMPDSEKAQHSSDFLKRLRARSADAQQNTQSISERSMKTPFVLKATTFLVGIKKCPKDIAKNVTSFCSGPAARNAVPNFHTCS